MQSPAKAWALVTGASLGIGLELAKCFARDGINLILVARSGDKLATLAAAWQKEYAIDVRCIALDLIQRDAADQVYTKVQETGIAIDYLVNNAGFGLFGLHKDLSLADEQDMLDLNIITLTRLCKLFLPNMLARGTGRIMNVASTAAFQPGPYMAVYYATKAYVLSYSEALAHELQGSGVTVTTLCPGPTTSGFQARSGMDMSGLVKNKVIMDATTVAEQGYRAMRGGERVKITGLMNRLFASSVGLLPRKLVTHIVAQVTGPK